MASNSANPGAVLDGIQENDTSKGAAVHNFDPNATPEQKAAKAGKAQDQLKPVGGTKSEGRAVVLPPSGGAQAMPTITISDFDTAPSPKPATKPNGPASTAPALAANGAPLKQPEASTSPNAQPMPGTIPTGEAPAIPDWYRVGWRAVSGFDRPLAEGEEKDRTIIEQFVSDSYYGQFYHNAGIIFFAVAASHYMTLFRLGWGWLFILLALCGTYYSTSITRVRRRARDDIQRELVKRRLASEHESAEWINQFLDRFWLIYEPVLSATIVASVDQVLSTQTPPFLDSIRLSTFTLGTKAPRIDKVRTFPSTPEDVVMMDWGFSFTPSDLSDVTPKQAKNRVNPKIVLDIRVGKGITAGMPILLEDMNFSGLMRVKLKLMANFPHVQLVELCFLEKPIFDYVLKPLGGETFGFDIGNIPGLSSFVRDQVHANLGPMMYDPNVFTLNLEQLLSGAPLDTATGVVQIHISSARNLKGVKLGGGTPDPYISVSINNRAQLARTRHKESTANPHFSSTHYILLTSANMNETLTFTVMDYNTRQKDSELGAASFELHGLLEDAMQEEVIRPVLKDGKERGEVKVAMSYFPVLTPKKIDGKEEPLPDTKVGICRLTLHQAKELDASKALSRDINPFAKVVVKETEIHRTKIFKHTLAPVWESPTEFLVADKASEVITVKVVDDRDFMKDPLIGYLSVKLQDLLDSKLEQRDWFPLSGCVSGKVRMTAEWKPLAMAGSMHGASAYVPPIGVVRLWMQRGSELKNVEGALGGKSDPYVRVMVNSITMARTDVVNNNLSPEWDQILYIPVHSLRELMVIECMDYQNLTKDRSLGTVELKVSDLAQEKIGDIKYPFESTGKHEHEDPVRLDTGNVYKGKLHFVAEFIPSLNLKGIKFEQQSSELDDRDNDTATIGSDEGDEGELDAGNAVGKHGPVPEGEKVPMGITYSGHGNEKPPTVANGTKPATEVEEAKPEAPVEDPSQGVELSKDELLKSPSGILIFNILDGQIARKAHLEILMDDGYWPSFASDKARSTKAHWEQVGEGMIKELDFGRVWLRLNANDEGENEDVVAELKLDAKAFLDQCLGKPAEFVLEDINGRNRSTVRIEAKFVPVPIKLEARESINNMGVLRVELLDGKDIHGADRSGKSDPFVVFTLNEEKVFKSQPKKKTLTPVWNENFELMVPSRVGGAFSLEAFDWNQLEQAKSLGSAKIELADLEPFQPTERSLPLVSAKHGEKGEIRIRILFHPQIIARTRKSTSTFSTAGRAMTQVGALPFGAGKGVIHGVGHAGTKAKGLFKFGGKGGKDDSDDDDGTIAAPAPAPDPPSAQVSEPSRGVVGGPAHPFPQTNTALLAEDTSPPAEYGKLKVTVVGAKDIGGGSGDSLKPYVTIKLGDKEFKTKHGAKTLTPEWDETFEFNAGPDTKMLNVAIFDHKTIGKDKPLGDADVDVWRHVQPGGSHPLSSADVWVELRDGPGLLRLRLDFEQGTIARTSSAASFKNPIGSPSRFSLSRRDKNGSE